MGYLAYIMYFKTNHINSEMQMTSCAGFGLAFRQQCVNQKTLPEGVKTLGTQCPFPSRGCFLGSFHGCFQLNLMNGTNASGITECYVQQSDLKPGMLWDKIPFLIHYFACELGSKLTEVLF